MKKKMILFIALAPIGWAVLSHLVFVGLKAQLPRPSVDQTPLWIWLWLFQMVLVIPFWKYILNLRLQDHQRWSLGGAGGYLCIAYLAVLPTPWLYDTWYTRWLVFGGIVSPIFEEMFTRHLLTPWLKEKWFKFLAVAFLSSTAFSLMHWGFNSAEAFHLPFNQQLDKFWMHFKFGMFLCVVFRFTKSTPIVIWLHILSNLRFVWGQN